MGDSLTIVILSPVKNQESKQHAVVGTSYRDGAYTSATVLIYWRITSVIMLGAAVILNLQYNPYTFFAYYHFWTCLHSFFAFCLLIYQYYFQSSQIENFVKVVYITSLSSQYFASIFYLLYIYNDELTTSYVLTLNIVTTPLFTNIIPLVVHFIEFTSDALVSDLYDGYIVAIEALVYLIIERTAYITTGRMYVPIFTWNPNTNAYFLALVFIGLQYVFYFLFQMLSTLKSVKGNSYK